MTQRQRFAWIVAAITVPIVMTCTAAPWQWVLAGCGAAAAFFCLVFLLAKRIGAGKSLSELACDAYGRGTGFLLIPAVLWTVLAAAGTAERSAAAFAYGPESRLCGSVLLLLTAIGAWRGQQALARCASVLAPLLAGAYAVLLAAAVPGIEPVWCAPWGDIIYMYPVLMAMLLPSAGLFLRCRDTARFPWKLLLALMLIPSIAAVIVCGNLSAQVVQAEVVPFYTLCRSMSILSVMERFEPLLSAVMYLGFFCLESLLISAAGSMLSAVISSRAKPPQLLHVALCGAAWGASMVPNGVPQGVLHVGAGLFWGIFPLLTLLVVAIKKDQNFDKKGVDKG